VRLPGIHTHPPTPVVVATLLSPPGRPARETPAGTAESGSYCTAALIPYALSGGVFGDGAADSAGRRNNNHFSIVEKDITRGL
jgi:hypothetical protein